MTITKKYADIYPVIQDFFKKKGIGINSRISTDICLSPYGSTYGPDILLITLVAEIKDKNEIENHLKSYWNQWDNENEKFGGKELNYKISQCFDDQSLSNLGSEVKGWIATIYGQLSYYTKAARLEDGWLIVECSENNKNEIHKLIAALKFLKDEEKISHYDVEEYENLVFCRIWYI